LISFLRVRIEGLTRSGPFAFFQFIMARPNDKEDQTHVATELKYAAALMKSVTARMDEVKRDAARSAAERGQTPPTDAFQLGDEEKKVLLNINNTGLLEGMAAGLVTLTLLRQFRHYQFRRIMQNVKASDGTTPPTSASQFTARTLLTPKSPFRQQTTTTNTTHNNSNNNTNNDAVHGALARATRSPFWVALGWITDLGAAFAMAVTVSALRMDQDQILKDIAAIPLVAGPSKVSQLFCPTVQTALAQLRRDAILPNERDILTRPRTPQLAAWVAFADHCQLRQAQEELLRREQGLSADAVVSIPPPGVVTIGSTSVQPPLVYDAEDADAAAAAGLLGNDFYDPRVDTDAGGVDFADDLSSYLDNEDQQNKKADKDSSRRRR
jgi:hypothetical protein